MNNPKIDIEEAQDEQELSYEDEFEELWGKQPDDGSEQDEDENEETGEQYADDETEGLGEQEATPVAPPVEIGRAHV